MIRWVIEHLGDRSDFDVELLDLLDHVLPFFDAVPPARTLRRVGNVKLTRLADDLAWWTTTLTAARRQQE